MIVDNCGLDGSEQNQIALNLWHEKNFRAFVEGSPDIIIRFDHDFHYVYVNSSIASITSLTPDQMIGKTKATGSGLGLATTYSIIKKHEGHIEVESQVGVGTVFYIYLLASFATLQPIISGPTATIVNSDGVALIMDDEEYMREVSKRMLELMGFHVDTAETGERALELQKAALEKGLHYKVIILDLTISGGKGGEDVLIDLREHDSAFKSIASSGYSDNPIMANPKQFGFDASIQKPYVRSELHKLISTIITS